MLDLILDGLKPKGGVKTLRLVFKNAFDPKSVAQPGPKTDEKMPICESVKNAAVDPPTRIHKFCFA